MLTFGASVGGMFECAVSPTLVLYLLFIQRNKKWKQTRALPAEILESLNLFIIIIIIIIILLLLFYYYYFSIFF